MLTIKQYHDALALIDNYHRENYHHLCEEIFNRFKRHDETRGINPIDEFGNERYILNGIAAYKINTATYYKFGLRAQYDKQVKTLFAPGIYIMSTRKSNYTILTKAQSVIDLAAETFKADIEALKFISSYDLNSKKSLHASMKNAFRKNKKNKVS